MITQVTFPTPKDLEPLREEALDGVDEAEFIRKHVHAINTTLSQNPAMYRAYGPYWWPIKQLLRDNGVDFGDEDEPITREHINYESPVDLICAAWSYQDYIIDTGAMNNHIHPFTVDDEPYDYSIEDGDLESMLVTL